MRATVQLTVGDPETAFALNDPPAVPYTMVHRSAVVQVTKEDQQAAAHSAQEPRRESCASVQVTPELRGGLSRVLCLHAFAEGLQLPFRSRAIDLRHDHACVGQSGSYERVARVPSWSCRRSLENS